MVYQENYSREAINAQYSSQSSLAYLPQSRNGLGCFGYWASPGSAFRVRAGLGLKNTCILGSEITRLKESKIIFFVSGLVWLFRKPGPGFFEYWAFVVWAQH